jgi:hypothetical protein
MATPRKPNSPPSAADSVRDDDDISLDEADERAQQRSRLPENRREKRQFEMAAPASPEREPAERAGPPGVDLHADTPRPATSDEIEAYEPAAGADQAGGAKVRSEPVAPVAVSREPAGGLDDLEEFIARTATEGPAAEKPARPRRPYTLVEKVCFGGGILVLLGLAVWLYRAVAGEANGVPAVSRPWPGLPMEGNLITIEEAAANWRGRTDRDRVGQMEVILPVPGQQRPDLIPQVVFTLDTGAGKSGYLRFIFRDSFGKPRGDTRVVHVESGNLKDMGQGEIVKSASEGSVYCSEGIQNLHAYHSYEADNVPRWSVEVAESADYGASDREWKHLGTFDVRNELVK